MTDQEFQQVVLTSVWFIIVALAVPQRTRTPLCVGFAIAWIFMLIRAAQ